MLKLNHVEKKLLKKVNLLDYKDNNLQMNGVIARFGLSGSKEYRMYASLAREVQALIARIRKLPSNSQVRQKVTEKLLDKMYKIGVTSNKLSLEDLEACAVTQLCKRRLTFVLTQLKMAQHMKHAQDLVEHGHIRVGNDVVKDPAMLITRQQEDLIQWANSSKYKEYIAEFNDERDDFELLNS